MVWCGIVVYYGPVVGYKADGRRTHCVTTALVGSVGSGSGYILSTQRHSDTMIRILVSLASSKLSFLNLKYIRSAFLPGDLPGPGVAPVL